MPLMKNVLSMMSYFIVSYFKEWCYTNCHQLMTQSCQHGVMEEWFREVQNGIGSGKRPDYILMWVI
jgi:hypothetical protein